MVRKTRRKVSPIPIVLAVFVGLLGVTASCENVSTTTSKPAATATAAAQVKALLNDGNGEDATGYFEATSPTLVAAAAGEDDSSFYDLGELLVRDGLGSTIIELGREMNGMWYEWSEHRAPSSEPDAYILSNT